MCELEALWKSEHLQFQKGIDVLNYSYECYEKT